MTEWLYMFVAGKYRSWPDLERWGFISAGHNAPPSGPLLQMKAGDLVYAYAPQRGYFAGAAVTAPAVRPRDFVVQGPFVSIQDGSRAGDSLPLDALLMTTLLASDQDSDLTELLVRVEWRRVLPVRKAISRPDMQVPSSTAERLSDQATARLLTDNLSHPVSEW